MQDKLRRELREEVTKSRSINIRKQLKGEFGDDLTFMSSGKEICNSRFLFSSGSNLPHKFIKACASGAAIPISVTIETSAQMIQSLFHAHKPQVNDHQHHRKLLNQMIISTQIFSIEHHGLFIGDVK